MQFNICDDFNFAPIKGSYIDALDRFYSNFIFLGYFMYEMQIVDITRQSKHGKMLRFSWKK